jgi:hypothetical protein
MEEEEEEEEYYQTGEAVSITSLANETILCDTESIKCMIMNEKYFSTELNLRCQ